MKIEKEIDELILNISEDPESLDNKFDELITLIKQSKGKIGLILKDEDLTKIINEVRSGSNTNDLKEYLKDSFKALKRSFSELINFSECSLGLVVNDPPKVESDKPNTILYDSDSRKIIVTKNFGYIIDNDGSNYLVKKHSITGDKTNFSNWKFISKQILNKNKLASILA